MAAKPLVLLIALCTLAVAAMAAGPVPVAVRASSAIHADALPWPPGVPIRVCAVRVEFQEDNVTGTTGNGRMGSGIPDTLTLDPLPHDRVYYEDHLRFLRHYYATVSKGKALIDSAAWAIFPPEDQAAYRLDHPMWHYNYNAGEELLNQRLVELFVESTAKAAEGGVDFTQFDAVLVFHAGVGKDFNLGFDATPFDIPSAYINRTDLDTYTGAVPVPAGVEHGLILPESENQTEALELGIELSLNGILVKLFGNWLGLPDLFNTETGLSGVGRWAMMDQGSGNILALVPAIPDAWSRVYMGWETPHVVTPSATGDTLQVARFGEGSPEIIKLPVTPREYYLVENRDADRDSIGFVELRDAAGRIMRVTQDGEISVEAGYRTTVEASHYDYGIPGSGLLVWHIDEDRIAEGLAANRVNTDLNHRGVDVVEADGAQDIGKEYGFASPGSGTELGWQEDAWYAENLEHRAANGNPVDVRFADETFPAARMYDGAFSRLELTAFSDIQPVMTFVARSRSALRGFPLELPSAEATWTPADLNGDGFTEIYFAAGDSLYSVDSSGTTLGLAALPAGTRLAFFAEPVDVDRDSLDELYFEGNRIGLGEVLSGVLTLRFTDVLPTPDIQVCPAQTVSGMGRLLAVEHDQSPEPPDALVASLYDLDLTLIGARQVAAGDAINRLPLNLESFPANRFVFLESGAATAVGIGDAGMEEVWRVEDGGIEPHGVVVAEPVRRTVYLKGFGYVDAQDGSVVGREPEFSAPGEDWNRDGIPDRGGPFGANDLVPEDAPRMTADSLWVTDLDASGDPDLIGFAKPQRLDSANGDTVYARLHAVSHNGSAFTGFPRAVSIPQAETPFELGLDQDLHYVTVAPADSGRFAYTVHKFLDARNAERFPYREQNAIINLGPLRPQANARENWLYCWPNPASDVSNIRITLSYPATAEVRIFDLAGRKVAELSGGSTGPGPLAFEVPWDVSGVESGVYVGRVIVHGNGRTEESQVKIAVVK